MTRWLAIAEWLYGAHARRTVFEPLVADWQRELADARSIRRPLVWLHGAMAFAVTFLTCTPFLVSASLPPRVRERMLIRLALFILVAATVLAVPLIREVDPPWSRGWLYLFALPSAIVLAWPFAMVSAVDTIHEAVEVPGHVKHAAVFKLAIAAVVVMILASGWLVPEANQRWRTAISSGTGSPPARALRELSTYELAIDPARATAAERSVTNETARARAIRRELNNRASLALLPLVVIWGRRRALRLPAGRWFSSRPTTMATVAIAFGYLAARFSDRFVENILMLPAGGAAWFPLAILIMVSVLRQHAADRSRQVRLA